MPIVCFRPTSKLCPVRLPVAPSREPCMTDTAIRATAETSAHAGHSRSIRAPRGNEISCKGWQQEAALRMLMNNLDAEVAERPQDLVVYGGTGKAARNWEAFDAIVRALRNLENDE